MTKFINDFHNFFLTPLALFFDSWFCVKLMKTEGAVWIIVDFTKPHGVLTTQ
jgi:hypothetical protein